MKITLEQLKQIIKEQIEGIKGPMNDRIDQRVAAELKEMDSFMKFRGNGKFSDGEGTTAEIKTLADRRIRVFATGKNVDTPEKLFRHGPASIKKIAIWIDSLSHYSDHFVR